MADIKKHWYKEMAVYQIWPRSFKDGNGDGIGDLKGVLSKLDYIKSLGVDAVWFSPLYKSPQKDYGYDISDYRDIAPEYGTLDEFKTVLDECHKRGLKVIMDMVVNHTSDQHEWFLESKKGHDNPCHDYYFWRKGKNGGKKPPNNWRSIFSEPAWKYDEGLGEYYLHLFATEQPDLNMDNPKVREEVKDIMRFWLEMGVDGFREDVITFISKKENLPNGIPIPIATGFEHYMGGPRLHEYLMEFKNDVLSKYDCMTVGEAPMMTPKKALKHIAEGPGQELNMMFHFQHMEADSFLTSWIRRPFNLKKLKKVYANWQEGLYGRAWNALYIENHDQPRIIDRYGSLEFREASAKMLAAMYICQSGTPFIYQGQEIGMTNINLPEIGMYDDVSTINNYKLGQKLRLSDKTIMKLAMYASRDNARTPVQWTGGKNAGFTGGEKAWFHINPNYTEINVEAAEKDENSILNFYRKLLKFRKENEIVIYGDYKEHYPDSDKLFVYERNYEGKRMLVICSFCDKPCVFKTPEGFDLGKGRLEIASYENAGNTGNNFILQPYECRVYMF
ncbi:MAG: alpha-glucosidase [Oscillospiraceae bacterium]|nr:alpha-glucosidase [Oscillospiraceae bacterium]